MTREVYDLSVDGKGSSMTITTIEDDGVDTVDAPFSPYCFIEQDDLSMMECRRLDVRPSGDAPDGYVRIEGDSYWDIRDYDDATVHDTYEADTEYTSDVLIDEGWSVAIPDPEDVLYFDIETDDRGEFTDPEDADTRIISIGAVGGDGEEFYFDDEYERELLRRFLNAADDYKVIVGWNAIGFDFPYVDARCLTNGIDPDWDRWVRLDLMPLYDTLGRPTETLSLKLDDTAERELGEGKTGVKPGSGRLWDMWESGDERLREYNVRDAEIVREIDEEYGLVELLHTVCDMCGYPPGETCYEGKYGNVKLAIGMVVDAKILSVARSRGEPMHNRGKYSDTGEFPGGDVLDPTPGMHRDVVTVDYSGMYPSIIRAFNLGPKTWAEDRDDLRVKFGDDALPDAIRGESGMFVDRSRRKSILAEAAEDLDEIRQESKEARDAAPTGSREYEIANQRDMGVKVANNCFSGDTDIMTPDGLRNIRDVEVGDPVYSINPETMECEVKPVVETVAEPNNYGELVHIDGEGVDLKVTPNHRMLASRHRGDDFDFHQAHELESGRWDLPSHEPVAGRTPDHFQSIDHGDLLEFMGWYISEGSCVQAEVTIHQKTERHRESIRALLDDMGLNYHAHEGGFTISNRNVFEWCRDQMGGCSGEKRIPDWAFDLDHSLLERLHGALMDGDGSDSRGSVKYTTTSDGLRDDFGRLLLHLGKRMRFREDEAHRVFENRTDGVAGSRNVEREDHDDDVYCVSVLDNHTVLAGRNGTMQWTGQTLFGVFASPFHRYYEPGMSENITLVGQKLVDIAARVSDERDEIRRVLYGDTDSVMVEINSEYIDGDLDAKVEAAKEVAAAIEAEIQRWAIEERGARGELLELDVDYVWDKFHQTDKKKRYFGRVVYDGGDRVDKVKYKGIEARQNDVPGPCRELQKELMHARCYDEPTAPIVEEYKEKLFSGDVDLDMATEKGLGKSVSAYEAATPPLHVRAAIAIRDEFGRGAVHVGNKVGYIKYGHDTGDWTWVYDDEMGRDLNHVHHSYLWSEKFESVMESIGVEPDAREQTGLSAFGAGAPDD